MRRSEYNVYQGIEYLQTFTDSAISFNGAFSEFIIESIHFAADKWVCIEGGLDVLTKNVWKKLHTKSQLKKGVTRIAVEEGKPTQPNTDSMRKVDLTDANLNWGQKTAIRGLTYGPATKVAIKFSRPWWITDCGITSAGVASTDQPLRICVYPSYNLHDGADNPAVLLCSYTWEQDALRIGSLDELKEVLLRGLARLHGVAYDAIAPLYVTHHAWNWHQDPNSVGAFAAFWPAEFSTLYPQLTCPAAGGLLHFAGEATSTHHAWIVGALESRYRPVSAFFERFGMRDAQDKLREKFGPPPGELETGEDGTEHLQVLLGR